MEERKHIVILAAGDFPTHPVPLQALKAADFVVCCDSAYSQFSIFNSQFSIPFIVIGDGDSLSDETRRQLGDRWLQVAEQDYNDLHKAMQWATTHYQLSATSYQLIAACGKREDHTLGNISYLVTFAEEHPGIDLEMLTDYGRFTVLRGERTYDAFPHQQVSIFSMEPDQPIHSEGLRWPLDGLHARRWWQASLNEPTAPTFTLRSTGWLIVYQTHEPKTTA